MKTLLSVLLGLMLLTSLVGISYATPTVQPTQSSGGNTNTCSQMSPSNPNYIADNCVVHNGEDHSSHEPHHGCVDRIGTDANCGCGEGITPHSFETSDIQGDFCEK